MSSQSGDKSPTRQSRFGDGASPHFKAQASGWAMVLVSIIAFLGLSGPVVGQVGEPQTLEGVLKAAREAREALPPMTFKVETVDFVSDVASTVPAAPTQKSEYSVAMRENLYDVTCRTYFAGEDGRMVPNMEMRRYWDGTRCWGWIRPLGAEDDTVRTVKQTAEARQRLLFDQDAGFFLEGRFIHNFAGDWIDLLDGDRTTRLSDRTEQVGGHACTVIEAETPHGTYKLWVDPQCGWRIRQAAIVVEHDDLAWGARLEDVSYPGLGQSLERIEMEIKDVSLEEISGCHIATGGTLVLKMFYEDGRASCTKKLVRRTDIELNPDFSSGGWFQVDFPEGAVAQYWFEGGARLLYVWKDGALLPAIDTAVIDKIDASIAAPSVAETSEESGNSDKWGLARGYCGIYSLYTVMKLADVPVQFDQLVKPEYVDSQVGSTLEQLGRAAEDFGLFAVPAKHMTPQVLWRSRYPMILHVKKNAGARNYNHYELFLGVKDDKAVLFDAPGPARLESFSNLLPRWDGTGLVVAAEPVNTATTFLPAWVQIVFIGLCAMGLVALAERLVRRRSRASFVRSFWRFAGRCAAYGGSLLVLSAVVGGAYHYVVEGGLMTNAEAIAEVQEAHLDDFMVKLTKEDVIGLTGSDAVLIDARYPADYGAGHIADAINVPVNATADERGEALKNVSKDAQTVVYCQSMGCPYAIKVATELKREGFSDISLFPGGWQEWQTED